MKRSRGETVGLDMTRTAEAAGTTGVLAYDLNIKDIEQVFFEKNGYRWDWVIAIRLRPPRAVPAKVRELIKVLLRAGLTVDCEFDTCGYTLLIKIGADVERLKFHAESVGYKMLLDPSCLQDVARSGVDEEQGLREPIRPFLIGHDPTVTDLSPFDFIYLAYEQSPPKCDWFYRQRKQDHPFRAIHRIKLIKSIITQQHVEGDVVCGLNMRGLLASGVVQAFYPVHDKQRIDDLLHHWIYSPRSFPWDLPISRIRAYFGEKITLYFAFVGHYATWLIAPALLGIIPFVMLWQQDFSKQAYDTPLPKLYAFFIALWAVFMLEFWKRKQKRYNLEWGMHGYEVREAVRPEFIGELDLSLRHDKLEKQYPLTYYRIKLGFSVALVTLMLCVVIAAVTAIFAIRFAIERTKASPYAGTLASVLNSLQITVLNAWYSRLAIALNQWENHRTDTQYQDALTAKLFAFQFVNSYSSMAYIAFIQPFDKERQCPGDNHCMGSLANNLTIIFLTRMVVSNMFGVILPLIRNFYQEYRDKGHIKHSELERQFKLAHYDPIMDLLFDYANIAITYGFAVLFVMANPIVPLLALVSSYVEIRGDGFKLLKVHRRPEPDGVEDIGTWQSVFTFITYASIVTNAALIAFTTTTEDGVESNEFWLFYILQVVGFGTLAFCSELVPDMPIAVQIQVPLMCVCDGQTERTEFFRHRVMLQTTDVQEDDTIQERAFNTEAVDPEDVLPEGWVEPEGEGKNRRNWEEEAVAAVTGGDLSMLITAAALQRASAR